MPIQTNQQPSLEALIENEDIGLEIFHPGGLAMTKELVELCHIDNHKIVLDVACGSGETAIYLAGQFSCKVIGVDHSDFLITKAKAKLPNHNSLNVEFQQGDAHQLNFKDNYFDIVISECTLCLLKKEIALAEMFRVCKPGGYVGIHDICWKHDTPQKIKQRLKELENETTETLAGWEQLFKQTGLSQIITINKSTAMKTFINKMQKELGFKRQLNIFLKILRFWGIKGLITVLKSELLFRSKYLNYAIIIGKK